MLFQWKYSNDCNYKATDVCGKFQENSAFKEDLFWHLQMDHLIRKNWWLIVILDIYSIGKYAYLCFSTFFLLLLLFIFSFYTSYYRSFVKFQFSVPIYNAVLLSCSLNLCSEINYVIMELDIYNCESFHLIIQFWMNFCYF